MTKEYLQDEDYMSLVNGLSDSSKKTYYYQYINMLKHFKIRSLYDLFDKDSALDVIETYLFSLNPSTALNALSIIKRLFDKESMPDILNEFDKQLREKKQGKRLERNKVLKERIIPYTTFVKELESITDPKKYIVNYLLLNMNCRNLDLKIKIVFSKKEAKDKSFNYLIVYKNKIDFVRNVYKTVDTYGIKTNAITSNKFKSMVDKFSDGNSVYLFTDMSARPLTESPELSSAIKRSTIDHMSESDVFKMVVTHIDKKGNLNKLKQVSKNRGTSVNNIMEYYHINVDKYN